MAALAGLCPLSTRSLYKVGMGLCAFNFVNMYGLRDITTDA